MRRRIARVLLAVTTGITGMTLAAAPAGAAVTCGSTITTSTTLTSDLVCPGQGVTVGASGVVFDLGGHTITGTTTPEPGFEGVVIQSNRTDVVVRNGTVRGFNRGVAIRPGANNALITGLVLDGNGLGIGAFGDPEANRFPLNARIVGNTVSNTTRFSGMQLAGNGHRVEGNTIINGAGDGIFYAGSNNLIVGNTIIDAGRGGIRQSSFPSTPGPFQNNRITANRISGHDRLGPSSGITVRLGASTQVTGNTVEGRRTSPGVFVEDSAGTLVTQNQLTDNGSGILVRGNASDTSLAANVATGNRQGITIESPATNTRLERNIAAENEFDGINVLAPSSILVGNTAYRNGSFGIRAVAGVVDGGGNRAFANGFAQCTPNIACS